MLSFIKKIPLFILINIVAISMSGCWNAKQLDNMSIVVGMAFDKPEPPDRVKITVQVVKASNLKKGKEGSGGSQDKAFYNLQHSSESVFSTIREFTHITSRKLYWPHNKIIIFSREVAETGIQQFLDFYLRDPETRSDVWILVSDGKASDILGTESQVAQIPSLNISELTEGVKSSSESSAVDLFDFSARLRSKTTAPIAGWLEIKESGMGKVVSTTGTAVFKKDKFVGTLNEKETRGLLWVLNKVKSGIINVPDIGNEKNNVTKVVSLEIIKAKGDFKVELDGKNVVVKIDIQEKGNLGAQESPVDYTKPDMIRYLEQQNELAIQNEIMSALEKAKMWNTDIFAIGEAVRRKYPKEWRDMEDKWDEIFPNIRVEIDIDTTIERAGNIGKPTNSEKG